MITSESTLFSADNSGARSLKCLKVLFSHVGKPGSILVVSILSSDPRKPKIRKGEIYRAVLTLSSKETHRITGSYFKARGNFVILLKKKEILPLANRLKKPVAQELRFLKMSRILFLSPFIV